MQITLPFDNVSSSTQSAIVNALKISYYTPVHRASSDGSDVSTQNGKRHDVTGVTRELMDVDDDDDDDCTAPLPGLETRHCRKYGIR